MGAIFRGRRCRFLQCLDTDWPLNSLHCICHCRALAPSKGILRAVAWPAACSLMLFTNCALICMTGWHSHLIVCTMSDSPTRSESKSGHKDQFKTIYSIFRRRALNCALLTLNIFLKIGCLFINRQFMRRCVCVWGGVQWTSCAADVFCRTFTICLTHQPNVICQNVMNQHLQFDHHCAAGANICKHLVSSPTHSNINIRSTSAQKQQRITVEQWWQVVHSSQHNLMSLGYSYDVCWHQQTDASYVNPEETWLLLSLIIYRTNSCIFVLLLCVTD